MEQRSEGLRKSAFDKPTRPNVVWNALPALTSTDDNAEFIQKVNVAKRDSTSVRGSPLFPAISPHKSRSWLKETLPVLMVELLPFFIAIGRYLYG